MRTHAGAVLLISTCAVLAVAQAQAQGSTAAKAPSVSAALKQLENDWIAAVKAGDADKLNSILGDDWVERYNNGPQTTKAAYVANVQSGAMKMESYEMSPMDVKVLGNVAVVQGGDTEKSSLNGKDTSGKYVWLDVFVKRGDNWVAVRSLNAITK